MSGRALLDHNSKSVLSHIALLISLLIVLFQATGLLNWLTMNGYWSYRLAQLALYGPLLIGVAALMLARGWEYPKGLLLFGLAILIIGGLYSTGPGFKGALVAYVSFIVLYVLARNQSHTYLFLKLSIYLTLLCSIALIAEAWSVVPMGVFSSSLGRSAFFYTNPNVAGLSLLILSLPGLAYLKATRLIVYFVVLTLAVLTTGSRSSLLTLVLLAFLVFVVNFGPVLTQRNRRNFLICCFLGVVGVMAAIGVLQLGVKSSERIFDFSRINYSNVVKLVNTPNSNPRYDERMRPLPSHVVRLRLLKRGWIEYTKSPWLGYGIDKAYALEVHSLYLFWPLSFGLFGWLVMPCFIFLLYKQGQIGKFSALVVATQSFFLHDIFITSSIMAALALVLSVRLSGGGYVDSTS